MHHGHSYNIMVGELTFFLSLQVKQEKDEIFTSQRKYGKNLVKKFCLEIAKHMRKYEYGPRVEPTLYKSMIGSLLYLIANHPYFYYSVGVCARYQVNPKESYLAIVKRIIRYVNQKIDYGIWY